MRRYLAATACGIGALAAVLVGTSALALAWDTDGRHALLALHTPCALGTGITLEFARIDTPPFSYQDEAVPADARMLRVRSLSWPGGLAGLVTNLECP